MEFHNFAEKTKKTEKGTCDTNHTMNSNDGKDDDSKDIDWH